MLDGSHRTNLATLDGSRWTNPATLDGFTGRIRPCLMASPDESYRARWFLSCKSCHPALAAPVGQSTLDGANGFHRRVRHCHFRECPLKKHLNNCGARLRGAQSAAAPVSWGPIRRDASASRGPISPDPQSQSDRGISALGPTIRCGTSAPKRQGRFSARHQSAQPVSTSRTKSTQAQNHQPKPPRENTELISFFAQALWGLATTLSVAPHSATSPSSSTRSLSASSDTSAKS